MNTGELKRAIGLTHDQHALAVAAAGEEGDLGERRDDGDAVGALEQAVRDRLVARVTQFLEYFAGNEQAALEPRLGVRHRGAEAEHEPAIRVNTGVEMRMSGVPFS